MIRAYEKSAAGNVASILNKQSAEGIGVHCEVRQSGISMRPMQSSSWQKKKNVILSWWDRMDAAASVGSSLAALPSKCSLSASAGTRLPLDLVDARDPAGRVPLWMMRLRMRPTNALAILGICVVSGIGPTQAQTTLGDAKRGQELSQRVCSGCHSVSPGSAATVNADVPTFAAIASRPDITAERLAGRIIVPHPPMPNVQLTVVEMRDIIAYILSLRQR